MEEEKKVSVHSADEERVLEYWKTQEIFKKSVERRDASKTYVFYDGPPFATGLPHYGHIVASVLKDVAPRFWTMKGYRVPRVWGWDCHGLPIENLVEKELGTQHKKDILELGVAKFNELCRSKVLLYADEWKKVIPRIGRWADMDQPYFTMSREFMESVWWVFKQMYDKDLIYEDYRSMHICPRCETTLSQSEVTEGYKDVKDLSMTVKFKVKNPEKLGLSGDVSILAWTTTPWTLPGNVALAVGKEMKYVMWSEVKDGRTEGYIVSAGSFERMKVQAVPAMIDVSQLIGLEYEPVFSSYASDASLKNRENGWKVYGADFVTDEDGTGIVHIAPAYGADDMALGKKENLPFVQHVGMDGLMCAEVVELAGQSVSPRAKNDPGDIREIDITVKKLLGEKVFGTEKILHSYPHCWRCDTALLNYATSSWFVKVEAQKEALLKNAEGITWAPEHIKEGRFGKWLQGARDWSISRQRFWASVIPIWRCDACAKLRVFGSATELEEASGKTVSDLHKHVVDEITVPCACGETMHRVPDVLDTWFDSGSMPYGQAHYPFENKEAFESAFPAQYIAEGQDQTRAWFYYLHVLSTSLFDAPAYQNVVVNGIVLAEDGKKMSKRLQNYPDPMEVVARYGADAVRHYLLASPVVHAENLRFSESGVDEVAKKFITILRNVLSFYTLYRTHDDGRTPSGAQVLDRWVLARLHETLTEETKAMETYDFAYASRVLQEFVTDLSTWYVRRSRERLKAEGDDRAEALATLRVTLETFAKMIAPSMPFLAELVYQELNGAFGGGEERLSVHLELWPEPNASWKDEDVLKQMGETRAVVSRALERRADAGKNVRQVLAKLTVTRPGGALSEEYVEVIKDEVNVKEVLFQTGELGVELDLVLTPELVREGTVREIMRRVNAMRKESGLTIEDRITLYVSSDEPEVKQALEEHKEDLLTGTLSKAIQFVNRPENTASFRTNEYDMEIGFEK